MIVLVVSKVTITKARTLVSLGGGRNLFHSPAVHKLQAEHVFFLFYISPGVDYWNTEENTKSSKATLTREYMRKAPYFQIVYSAQVACQG